MRIGVPREILDSEARVAITPVAAKTLLQAGHEVGIETGAGVESGFPDEAYRRLGVRVLASAGEVYEFGQLILKVKQPLASDLEHLRADHLLFTFLHLAAEPRLADELRSIGLRAYAYETIRLPDGSLPLLLPMSEIAGRMAVQVGTHWLERPQGGSGVLLSGAPGIGRGKVLVLGGGVAGSQTTKLALGLGAEVTLVEKHPLRIRELEANFGDRANVLASDTCDLSEQVESSDLVVGAVLLPGRRPPTLVSKEMVATMRPGSVIIDIAVDQGGCIETICPTSHSHPTYLESGVLHYGVTNMPGAVPRTATQALSAATLPYVLDLAAGEELPGGLNVDRGSVVHPEVREAVKG